MEYSERERLLSSIASPYLLCRVGSQDYILKHPHAATRYKADLVYQYALEDCRFEEFLQAPAPYLVNQGLIVANYEESITALTKSIKDLQVELYKSLINPVAQKDIRKRLGLTREKLNKTLNAKHMLDEVTPEGHASLCRLQYLIFKMTYYRGGRLWTRRADINYKIMERLIYLYLTSRIDSTRLRELARTEPWGTIYTAGKPNPFGVKAVDLTENQRDLLYYTTMYENANQSMEPPSEDVLKDDDIFDGWMHETIRRSKEDKKERTVKNSVGKKYQDAQELFIPINRVDSSGRVKTPEEIEEELKEINSLNDFSVTMLKKQRTAAIHAHGEISEAQLPDKQMELQNMARENALKSRKK
jgi:hypothetical protein